MMLSCTSYVALETYLQLFDCEATICEAYSESSGVQEMCAANTIYIGTSTNTIFEACVKSYMVS